MSDTVETVLQGMRVPSMQRVYVLGCLERRVTVYSQQVRAINLVHALLANRQLERDAHLAVVGAGAAGLTCAAAALYRGARVTLLEQCPRVLPIFQLARPEAPVNRWLHPRVYDWPQPGWNDARARLPLLDWQAGSVAEVAGRLLTGWRAIADEYAGRLDLQVGASKIRIVKPRDSDVTLTWTSKLDSGRKKTGRGQFAAVVLAVGFGLERYARDSERSYWEPDDLDSSAGFRPGVDTPRGWLISGCGDGGLTDLLRVRIEDFRHERILTDLLPADASRLEGQIRDIEADPRARGPEAAEFLSAEYARLEVAEVVERMQLREDTDATLNSPDADYLRPEASALNRFLARQLEAAGGFDLEPGLIESVADGDDGKVRVTFDSGIAADYDRIVRRHGPKAALRDFPQVWNALDSRRKEWRTSPQLLDQTRRPIWEPGEFGPEDRTAPSRGRRAHGTDDDDAGTSAGDLDAAERCYRERVIAEFKALRVSLGSLGKVDIPLEDVFVDLHCVGQIPEAADAFSADERRVLAEYQQADEPTRYELMNQLDDRRYQRWRKLRAESAPLWQRRSIVELMAGRRAPLVLLGDPGSGKSTLLQVLALRAARNVGAERLLPVFVRLAAFDDYLATVEAHTPLADFLSIYWTRCLGVNLPELADVVRRALDEGRALILLDGLDEVLTRTRRRSVVRHVERLINHCAGQGNRFAITSRVIGYRDEPLSGNHEHATVLDLDRGDRELLVRRWSLALETWSARSATADAQRAADALAERLLGQFANKPHLAQLAVNPLMASMLVRLARSRDGRLPEQRVLVYREFTDMLLEQWPDERSQDARQSEVPSTDLPELQMHLGDLALHLHREHPSGTAPRRALEAALTDSCLPFHSRDPSRPSDAERARAAARARKLLDEMRQRLGVIAERGPDAYGFLHLSHQEYHAAGALARMGAARRWAVLSRHLHDPRWREVLLFCAGRLGHLDLRVADVDALVRGILTAESPYEDQLYRDVFLAADVIGADVRASMAVMDLVAERLRELFDDPLSEVTTKAKDRFVELAAVGHQPTLDFLVTLLQASDDLEVCISWLWRLVSIISRPRCQHLRAHLLHWYQSIDWSHISAEVGFRVAADMVAGWSPGDTEVESLLCELAENPRYRDSLAWQLPTGSDELLPRVRAVLVRYFSSARTPGELDIAIRLAPADPDVQARALELWETQRHCLDWQDSVADAAARLAEHQPAWRRRVLDALTGDDAELSAALLEYLDELASTDSDIRQSVIALTQHEWLDMQYPAYQALRAASRVHSDTRTVLQCGLAHHDSTIRIAVTRALGPFVPLEPELSALLQEQLDDPASRLFALTALAPLASEEPALGQKLRAGLHLRHTATVQRGIETVAPLVIRSASLQVRLVEFLDACNVETRIAAIRALAPVLKNAPTIRTCIQEKCLASPYEDEVTAAISALAPWAAQPSLRDALLVELAQSRARVAAARALAEHAPTDPKVVSAFRTLAGNLHVHNARGDGSALKAAKLMLGKDPRTTEQLMASGLMQEPEEDAPAIITQLLEMPGVGEQLRPLVTASLASPFHRNPRLWLWNLLKDQDSLLDTLLQAARAGDMVAMEAIAAGAVSNDRILVLLCDTLEMRCDVFILTALRPLVADNPRIRELFQHWLRRAGHGVATPATAIVTGLAGALASAPLLRPELLPWLGMRASHMHLSSNQRARWLLARRYAEVLAPDTPLWANLETMIDSDAWQARQGAVWTFTSWDGELPVQLMDRLLATVDDRRAEESWLYRLQAAECFLNHRDPEFSNEAIAVVEEALCFGQEPWYLDFGRRVRTRAATVLASLEPALPNPRLTELIATRLRDEPARRVKEDLYDTLLALATIDSSHPDRPS